MGVLGPGARSILTITNDSTTASIACAFSKAGPIINGTQTYTTIPAVINGAGSYTVPPGLTGSFGPLFVPSDPMNCIASAPNTPVTIMAR
jgi:hypothetical protein